LPVIFLVFDVKRGDVRYLKALDVPDVPSFLLRGVEELKLQRARYWLPPD
jgi:hypothetical protein